MKYTFSLFFLLVFTSLSNNLYTDQFFFSGIEAYRDREYDSAIYFFTQAAKSGDGEAQFLLGKIYSEGLGVNIDNIKSLMWFTIADINNVRVADRYGSRLKTKMSVVEIEYSLKQANEWLEIYHK
jgi:TPR repeat protein